MLVKGSPEAIGARLREGQKPEDYDERAARLAKGGMRVLALAYKHPRSDAEGQQCEESRAVAEEGLCFAGFVSFSCRVRKDTRAVVLQLREGAHSVAMVTGDAILTALHVANEVGGEGCGARILVCCCSLGCWWRYRMVMTVWILVVTMAQPGYFLWKLRYGMGCRCCGCHTVDFCG